jgi:hypothetical protein
MLDRISSLELSEWESYERLSGPLGTSWQDEIRGMIHEQLQQLNRLTGAAHFTDRKHRKNPAPEPKHVPRPWELHKREDEDQEDPDEDEETAEEEDHRYFGSGGGDD